VPWSVNDRSLGCSVRCSDEALRCPLPYQASHRRLRTSKISGGRSSQVGYQRSQRPNQRRADTETRPRLWSEYVRAAPGILRTSRLVSLPAWERWVSTAQGRHLSWRRKTSTSPEVKLRRAVHAAGGRFRLHLKIAKGCAPDFVLPSRRVAVFVDGCFWHGFAHKYGVVVVRHDRGLAGPARPTASPSSCGATSACAAAERHGHAQHEAEVVPVAVVLNLVDIDFRGEQGD
jgi:hypothetical protein